ncbi:hypothetical protein LUZ62_032456 [Rhynchospora pubera]|uniref:Uncharacterized protein n=1 Tax=Rhynchospora pubera TaxID=906938 RepID=A0AAV8HPU4_9POAL|nr:hypothetical protein LUZ62_032456 [Rhynchospora pubera]
MAVSAFKSTSRRGNNYTNPSPSPSLSSSSTSTTSRDQFSRDSHSLKKAPIRRSRSVSAEQRGQLLRLRGEYGNTRDNPLFDCSSGSSKSSSSEKEKIGTGKERGEGVCTDNRGRGGRALGSGTQKPRERSMSRVDPVRRRLRSVSRGPSRCNESDYPSTDTDEGRIYEAVRSEVQRAVSQVRDDLEHVIKGRSTRDILSDSDGADIASDIRTDYASKLEQSHERILKLRAELVVEEQRKEELSKILKEVLSSPESSGSSKTRLKRRTSIERNEVSRRLEEEAMSYFEECVSISNFDGSDISSLEDPVPNSAVCRQTENDLLILNEEIAFAESLLSNGHEECDNHSPRSVSLKGSDMALSHSSSYTKYSKPKSVYYNNDLVSDFDTSSESFRFVFGQPEEHTEHPKSKDDFTNFGNGCDEEKLVSLKITRTRYYDDDYISKGLDESLLKDVVMFRNRLNSGGLLLCNIRTF